MESIRLESVQNFRLSSGQRGHIVPQEFLGADIGPDPQPPPRSAGLREAHSFSLFEQFLEDLVHSLAGPSSLASVGAETGLDSRASNFRPVAPPRRSRGGMASAEGSGIPASVHTPDRCLAMRPAS